MSKGMKLPKERMYEAGTRPSKRKARASTKETITLIASQRASGKNPSRENRLGYPLFLPNRLICTLLSNFVRTGISLFTS
jgi:hypothetical protein